MHHMTLSAITQRGSLPYGITPCAELYEDSALMEGAIISCGSQGASHDEMHLPDWIAAPLPETIDVFLSSHTHGLGREFSIRTFDGTAVGETVDTNDDWHSPAIVQYDPPLVIPEGEGFEWTCTWRNDGDAEVGYGLKATDEMCNLAVVHTPFDLTAACEVVETSDGVLWSP